MTTTEKKEPKLTLHLVMHMNGGSKFSAKTQEFYVDGEKTGIFMRVETDGWPTYRYTARELVKGEETYNLMDPASTGKKAMAWLLERHNQEKGEI